MDKIQPPTSPLSQPYWDACKKGKLKMQQCVACGRFQFYPRIICSICSGDSLEWVTVSGNGTVASFTTIARAVSKAYEAPYVVALIDLDEGPRMMSSISDSGVNDLKVGSRVRVTFEEWSKDIMMPVFRIV